MRALVDRIKGYDGTGARREEEVMGEIIASAIIRYKRSPNAVPIHTDVPEEIAMDPVLIEQVLINLFDNVSSYGETATLIWPALYMCENEA